MVMVLKPCHKWRLYHLMLILYHPIVALFSSHETYSKKWWIFPCPIASGKHHETSGYGSKLGTPKLWMVNTKLDVSICGPLGLPFWPTSIWNMSHLRGWHPLLGINDQQALYEVLASNFFFRFKCRFIGDQNHLALFGGFFQWIGLRENLQETMVFTIKYRGFL